MDDLDVFWNTHFGRSASPIERRMIAAFDRTVGAEDPMFPVLMMQVCNLYETLGSHEKAVLRHGPALERQMVSLGQNAEQLSKGVQALLRKLSTLSEASERLLMIQDRLLGQRNIEARVGSLPEWVKALLVALTTAVVLMLGGVLSTMI